MKILFLTSYVDPSSGPSVLSRLAERLQQEGHEVRILTTTCGFDSDIIRSVRLGGALEAIDRAFNKIVPHYFSLIYRKLLNAIEEFDPDIINIHWTHGRTVPLRLIPKLCASWPVFWTIHDLWPITAGTFFEYTGGEVLLRRRRDTPLGKLKRKFRFSPQALLRYKARLLGPLALHTISPSKWLRDKVDASPVFRSAINHHIPNGVNMDVFRPMDKHALRARYGVPEDGKVILFLSANLADGRKGFYYFVKALESLKIADPALVGKITTLLIGEYGQEARAFLPTRVVNLGKTSDVRQLAEYYNLSDVFVSASLADNFPSTSLESIACGTPVAAFDVGGVSEIVVDGETGLLCANMDAEALARNVRRILVDPNLQARLAEGARARAVAKFGMDGFAHAYLDIFAQALVEKGRVREQGEVAVKRSA